MKKPIVRSTFIYKITFLLLVSVVFFQCEEPVYTPKPRAYPKVEYPEKTYQAFQEDYCTMSFEYPTYAKIEQDRFFFGDAPPSTCWFDINFPDFDAVLHCSYIAIDKKNTLETLQKDAFKMTDWHNKKATFTEDKFYENKNHVKGMTFDIEGPVASPIQFYLTDSLQEKHFIRGAFYFNSRTDQDSLAPILKFVRTDIQRMLDTFDWGEKK